MPIISTFFGIMIRMFFDDHTPPHFHAEYQGDFRFPRKDCTRINPLSDGPPADPPVGNNSTAPSWNRTGDGPIGWSPSRRSLR